jgi:LuxR family transcriptional regulator, maltose regulon positive regulatory protein
MKLGILGRVHLRIVYGLQAAHEPRGTKPQKKVSSSNAMRRADRPVKYAKVAHPRLFNAVPRPRLFARLEELRGSHSVIWIASPPGAGKTTVVASYLSATKAPSVWYQFDEGDADLASFFFFLGQTLHRSGPALPWLAPELADDVPRFARLFFREYFARLPERAIVVLDNVQEFDWEGSGNLLEIAFSEVPDGITVVAVSRDAPPERLARLELAGRVATLGWSELRLDAQESMALARQDDGTEAASQDWLDRLDGWAAGIVMLREHMTESASGPPVADILLSDGQQAVFRYFAGEILGRMPPAWQRMLLLLSCLPGISSADAQQLTGDPAAARLMGRLFHHRLFVERRGPAPFTYHFHALFREFLQYEAHRRLDAAERAALLERAAAILAAQGRVNEATRLYHEAGAYPQLAGLLLASAETMLATGRGQSWREWLGWIPADIAEGEPRLRYWEGVSLNQTDPGGARGVLALAEQTFAANGDTVHRLLAIAAIIESCFYEWADFQALPAWIDAMAISLRELDLDSLDPETDARIHSRLTLALSIARPDSPLLELSAERALRALPQVRSGAERLAAGALLMMYLNWGRVAAARELATMLAPLVDDPAIAPFHRISWCRAVIYRHQLDGQLAIAQDTVAKALRLAIDFGLERMQFQLHFRNGLNLLIAGDLAAVPELLAHMRGMMSPARKLELVYVRILETSYFAQTGAVANALQTAEDAVQAGAEASLASAPPRWQSVMLLAYCHAQTGGLEQAKDWSRQAVAVAFGPEQAAAAAEAKFIAAYVDHVHGRTPQALDSLRRLLRTQREREASFPLLMRLIPGVAQTLLSLALREGIEVDYVRRKIVERVFAAPDDITPDWPRPIAVRALGRMELSFDGEPARSSGKAQKRPLELLKALLAAGEQGKAQATLAKQPWPEVDDPKASLNVTVHRLRKLLGDEKALRVVGGNVVLDEDRIWSDVRALGQLCEQVDALSADAEPGVARRLALTLLDLYRGPFCGDDEEAWLLPAREAWRRRFLAAVVRLGTLLEQASDWAAAGRLYARALEAEPLAETSHRGLMRCAHAQQDPAAAFSAYRRCRDILSIVLGRAPSAETEALAVGLGLKERPAV